MTDTLSRRLFLNRSGMAASVSLLPPGLAQAAAAKLKAGDIIARIKSHVGVPWRAQTVDVIKGGGNPNTIVTGITTSFMATLDVLQKSAKRGHNFVITHEPTFWTNLDLGEGLAEDPLYHHKLDFIRQNNLVVFRFHDHWHARKPDGIVEGVTKQLGWQDYPVDTVHNVVELPRTVTLEALALELKNKLHSDNIRVMGDPRLKVRKVGRGFNKLAGEVGQQVFADAFIVKEADRENDLAEWCRDTIRSGQQKGYIFISHNRGEEAGMDNCAHWVRAFVPEVPVEFIPSGDDFWRTLKTKGI
jgi:putative NIF3 family GTP cyclohydrolase 1 type 2